MIVSHNPREDRSIKALALVMVALVAVLTTVRACQTFRTLTTPGNLAAIEAERRAYWSSRE